MDSRDADLLMIPSYTYTTSDAHRVFKTFSMNQELTYRFQDRVGHDVATLTSRDTLEYTQPAASRAIGIVTIATLFMALPVAIPLDTMVLGGHAVDVEEASLDRLVRRQTDEIYMKRTALVVPTAGPGLAQR